MLEYNMCFISLVSQFLRETNDELEPLKTELDAYFNLSIFDKRTKKMICYGNINNIINSSEFKKWYKKTLKKRYWRGGNKRCQILNIL